MGRSGRAVPIATDRDRSWEEVEHAMDTTLPQDPTRHRLALFLKSAYVEYLFGAVITFNVVLIILETDSTASGGSEADWVTTSNSILFWFYCIELLFKLYVYRSKFCNDTMNMFDALVVLSDLVPSVINLVVGSTHKSTFSITRCFRLVRLARTLRLLRQSHELHTLMVSFLAGMKAVSWGLILVAALILIWAILSVQLLNGLNQEIWRDRTDCERCQYAFRSVWSAALTIIQTVIAGDSWGVLALPLVEESGWTLLFFGGVIVSIDLALLNLILAVMIECAQDAKQLDDHQKALFCENAKAKAKVDLYNVCLDMDENKNGSLSIEEFMHAFQNNVKFSDLLTVMDISQDDMHCAFQVLDSDCSGNVECEEFVERLYRMKTHETQQVLFTVSEIKKMLLEDRAATKRLSGLSPKNKSGNSLGNESGQALEKQSRDGSGDESGLAPEKKTGSVSGTELQDQLLLTDVHQLNLESGQDPRPARHAEEMVEQLLQISREVDASLQSLMQHTEAFMQNLSHTARSQAQSLSSMRNEFPHVSHGPPCGKEVSIKERAACLELAELEKCGLRVKWSG